jgi:hypothetical protein
MIKLISKKMRKFSEIENPGPVLHVMAKMLLQFFGDIHT